MSKAADRAKLLDEYMGVAGQVEALVKRDVGETTLDPAKVARWQTLYAQPGGEALEVLRRRDSMLRQGGVAQHDPSIAELEEWTAYARKILKGAPNQAE